MKSEKKPHLVESSDLDNATPPGVDLKYSMDVSKGGRRVRDVKLSNARNTSSFYATTTMAESNDVDDSSTAGQVESTPKDVNDKLLISEAGEIPQTPPNAPLEVNGALQEDSKKEESGELSPQNAVGTSAETNSEGQLQNHSADVGGEVNEAVVMRTDAEAAFQDLNDEGKRQTMYDKRNLLASTCDDCAEQQLKKEDPSQGQNADDSTNSLNSLDTGQQQRRDQPSSPQPGKKKKVRKSGKEAAAKRRSLSPERPRRVQELLESRPEVAPVPNTSEVGHSNTNTIATVSSKDLFKWPRYVSHAREDFQLASTSSDIRSFHSASLPSLDAFKESSPTTTADQTHRNTSNTICLATSTARTSKNSGQCSNVIQNGQKINNNSNSLNSGTKGYRNTSVLSTSNQKEIGGNALRKSLGSNPLTITGGSSSSSSSSSNAPRWRPTSHLKKKKS